MLGKTFKGMTDEMLAWQTERFRSSPIDRGDWVVTLRPEQVVEIAFDGVQRSTRYPGGMALRFARVLRYRDDKPVSTRSTPCRPSGSSPAGERRCGGRGVTGLSPLSVADGT